MHVAICDDNVADRKHLERLLSRESDKRAGTPNILYIDSYGDKYHFLTNPLKYNIIFMDMCSRPGLIEEILDELEKLEYNAPLVLYSSKIDYTTIPNLPGYVLHAKKPYIPDPLPDFLAYGDKNVIGHIDTILVHNNGIIHEVPKNNIMYITSETSQNKIYLLDNTNFNVDENIDDLYQMLKSYTEFEKINKNTIANFKFVSAVMLFNIMMQDYSEFRISPFDSKTFRYLKEDVDCID